LGATPLTPLNRHRGGACTGADRAARVCHRHPDAGRACGPAVKGEADAV